MQKELSKNNVSVAMTALAHTNWASSVSNIHSKCDFAVLQDSSAVDAWGKMKTPGKEYLWVFDKQGVVVAFFKPWEISLGNSSNYSKLKNLLTTLAK